MSEATKTYILDANVFVQAHRYHYAFDIAPKFWEAIEHLASAHRVLSIDRIKDELDKGKDDLTIWASTKCAHAFKPSTDPDIIAAFAKTMNWAQTQGFTSGALAQFAAVADGWLVACAMVHGYTVVTHEVYEAHRKNKIKIPNVCKAFNVECIGPFSMLRELGVKLG